ARMPFQNFSGNAEQEALTRSMLVDGENLVAIIDTEHRFISVTDKRLILDEKDGDYSVIQNSNIVAIEVSKDSKGGRFVKVHFGSGLSRMLGAPDDAQAASIAGAAAGG
ncbi:MAG: hypothetical protein ABL886_15990, partial [Rhodoglobus sp.]